MPVWCGSYCCKAIAVVVALLTVFYSVIVNSLLHPTHGGSSISTNSTTIAGLLPNLCQHTVKYETNGFVSFSMCVGHSEQDMKNGMSIISLIKSRGYLPSCRVLQLMLWMHAETTETKTLPRDFFIDIGANIGSCTVAIASLGFPVVSVEPVKQHVDAIRGSIGLNPSFNIDVQHAGISSETKVIRANFAHGGRNWGSTIFEEAGQAENAEAELQLRTTSQIVGSRRISMMKIDCEGCEWAALKSTRRLLRRIPMVKIELTQKQYTAGNETVGPERIVQFLHENGFEMYADIWPEGHLYFGKQHNDILDIDKMFGSTRFKLQSSSKELDDCARRMLQTPVDAKGFNMKTFSKYGTDLIAIEKSLSDRMKRRWGLTSLQSVEQPPPPPPAGPIVNR